MLYRNGNVDKFPLKRHRPGLQQCRSQGVRLLPPEGPVRGIRQASAAATATTSAPFDDYHKARGLRWPVVNGKETRWRYQRRQRSLRQGWAPAYQFYGNPDGKAAHLRPAL
ncbi:hypothetical protein ACU4HD_46080 [Cupriavidus basilensis]